MQSTSTDSDACSLDSARNDIQGFISASFGDLPHSAYCFVHFASRAGLKDFLNSIRPQITTAAKWPKINGIKQKPENPLNIALTMEGLLLAGFPESSASSFPVEFRLGMADSVVSNRLGDADSPSDPSHWEFGQSGSPSIHLLLILSAKTPEIRKARVSFLQSEIERCGGKMISVQEGDLLPENKEHFGFRDGIAEVQIAGLQKTGVAAGEFILGYPNETGFRPLSPWLPASDDTEEVLPPAEGADASGYHDFGRNGTYLVYRKLEQDVAGFWNFLKTESTRLFGTTDLRDIVRIAAKMVGRWPSGAPLVMSPDADNPAFAEQNQFLFANEDPHGYACPISSHIRRSNPRDHLFPCRPEESLKMTARHRLIRRGKPYGRPLFNLEILNRLDDTDALQAILNLRDEPTEKRGLHFLCLNATIAGQFEFVQQNWLNNPQFNRVRSNPDPVIGGRDAKGCMTIPSSVGFEKTNSAPSFVTARAGAYFFMPSLTALQWLSGPSPGIKIYKDANNIRHSNDARES